jgi:hypothetical protein
MVLVHEDDPQHRAHAFILDLPSDWQFVPEE